VPGPRILSGLDDTLRTLSGFNDDALTPLLAQVDEPLPPEEFPTADENLPTEFTCPKCKYSWSGKPG